MRTITKRTAAATVAALVLAGCGGAADSGGAPLASGIGVEGAWTVEVRNADGTLDERVEFHNDLTLNGESNLVQLLASTRTVGGIILEVGGQQPAPGEALGLCNDIDGATTSCYVTPEKGSETRADAPNVFENGVVSTFQDRLDVAGTATAAFDGVVTRVSTILMTCSETIEPVNCNAAVLNRPFFTTTTLPNPVDVAAGQSIQVEVQLSFGTLGG